MAGRRGFLLATVYGIVAASLPLAVVMRRSDTQPAAPGPRAAAIGFTASLANSPFPYDGPAGPGGRPFFDVRDPRTRRRAHTTGDGTILPEHPHYTDDRVLFHLPTGFAPSRPFEILVFFHGHGSEIERTIGQELDLPGQLEASGRNMVLIAPQLAFEAPDSSPGKLGLSGGLRRLLDEAASVLAQRTGGPDDERAFRQAPVVLSAYSGGYRSVAASLARGGLGRRIRGVLLLDALYGDLPLFSRWIIERWHDGFFVSLYGPSTERWHDELKALLLKRHRRPGWRLPARIKAGRHAFISVPTAHQDLPLSGPPATPLGEMLRRLRINI